MRLFVATRLRASKDEDIINAIQGIDQGEISELIRRGLRLALNNVKQIGQNNRSQPKILDWNHLR